jgi:hypothetical protein
MGIVLDFQGPLNFSSATLAPLDASFVAEMWKRTELSPTFLRATSRW